MATLHLVDDDAAWIALLESGENGSVSSLITLDDAGTTYVRHLQGQLAASQLARLMAYIHQAEAGDTAVLTVDGRTALWQASGRGAAYEHPGVVVFPSFAGSESGMGAAGEAYEQALDDLAMMRGAGVLAVDSSEPQPTRHSSRRSAHAPLDVPPSFPSPGL